MGKQTKTMASRLDLKKLDAKFDIHYVHISSPNILQET